MALFEPFTDLVKAFREAIALIDDIDRQFDKVRGKLDKGTRTKIAAAFASLHFDVGYIPRLLEDIAKARSQSNQVAATAAENQPDSDKTKHANIARRNASEAIVNRVNSTADEVGHAYWQLARQSRYLVEELGLEFSQEGYRIEKEDLRYRLLQYARAVESENLSEKQIVRHAREIALTIERFNESLRHLHDKILGKPSSAPTISDLQKRLVKGHGGIDGGG
ncbi:hypothetical protein [Rhizobium leguminosarum]|uniref:hypothetical protein n=1 Tax=Rhizobium leguminosarum TaxID=384 RepID=UPI003F97A674